MGTSHLSAINFAELRRTVISVCADVTQALCCSCRVHALLCQDNATMWCPAGMWEFPSKVMDPAEACQQAIRQAALGQLLKDLIGLHTQEPNSSLTVSHIGTATHTFSHIQLTMIVDRLTLEVRIVEFNWSLLRMLLTVHVSPQIVLQFAWCCITSERIKEDAC